MSPSSVVLLQFAAFTMRGHSSRGTREESMKTQSPVGLPTVLSFVVEMQPSLVGLIKQVAPALVGTSPEAAT
jgi:hypothetical protein